MAKKVIFLFFLFSIFGCKDKECPWPYPNVNIPLRDSNVNWLKGLPSDTNITASSNKGRAMNYRLTPSFSFEGFGTFNCDIQCGEKHYLPYRSSIYDYNFNLLVYKHWDKDKLLICGVYKTNTFHDDDSNGEINLLDKINKKISISSERYPYQNYYLDTTYNVIDTFKSNNKTYFDVYKIDFSDKKYSIDDKIKTYYLDIKFGVLRFDTFDGEIWTFNL